MGSTQPKQFCLVKIAASVAVSGRGEWANRPKGWKGRPRPGVMVRDPQRLLVGVGICLDGWMSRVGREVRMDGSKVRISK